jgi:hypothetical protein
MSDVKKPLPDPLVRQRMFPEPGQIFDFAPVGLEAAIKDALIAVDTNVLLIPYTAGQASLREIRRTYDQLTREGLPSNTGTGSQRIRRQSGGENKNPTEMRTGNKRSTT